MWSRNSLDGQPADMDLVISVFIEDWGVVIPGCRGRYLTHLLFGNLVHTFEDWGFFDTSGVRVSSSVDGLFLQGWNLLTGRNSEVVEPHLGVSRVLVADDLLVTYKLMDTCFMVWDSGLPVSLGGIIVVIEVRGFFILICRCRWIGASRFGDSASLVPMTLSGPLAEGRTRHLRFPRSEDSSTLVEFGAPSSGWTRTL